MVAREEKEKNPKNWNFKVRWVGYESEEDSWATWTVVKDLDVDEYCKEHPVEIDELVGQ
jgi:hypothetical protein